ncbi:hypothetical protein DICVIV_11303 [Dictyocaulus viviparus]|uniref:Uncharacterized protein n=1 Tax=Dictyocaulus viviparus TaxID=29172 RepID=A0A0D8XK77_DICVI|nr:hypothetical protein DICVIV_11303 [Dictyocaulus viviparus]
MITTDNESKKLILSFDLHQATYGCTMSSMPPLHPMFLRKDPVTLLLCPKRMPRHFSNPSFSGVQRKTAVNSSRSKSRTHFEVNEELSATNSWGFDDEAMKIPEIVKPSTKAIITSTLNYELIDPNRNGLLKDIGSINVGFGVGVGVPGNDPVRVGTKN